MTIADALGWVVVVFIAGLGAAILFFVWTGKINLTLLISEQNGVGSMSRFQLLIFTMLVGASIFIVDAVRRRKRTEAAGVDPRRSARLDGHQRQFIPGEQGHPAQRREFEPAR
ncbi:MAG TPA: hypothetical protein VMJ75_22435 [Candidatus Acidoferrales bacterium]|nr:hypothetical protein [Candidatus Acidoferrales bacterium]